MLTLFLVIDLRKLLRASDFVLDAGAFVASAALRSSS